MRTKFSSSDEFVRNTVLTNPQKMCVIFSMSDSFIQFGKKKNQSIYFWEAQIPPWLEMKVFPTFQFKLLTVFLLGGNRWTEMTFCIDLSWIYLFGLDPLTFNSELLEDLNRWNWYLEAFLNRLAIFKFYSDGKLPWQIGYINCRFKRYALSKNLNCLQGTVTGIFSWQSHFC